MEENFDIAIVGAGLGGLLCGVILAKEGKKVILIEQNDQAGGCLQTFAFQQKVFDSCVHYIGAFDEHQTQHKIFNYAGIMNDLKIEKLRNNAFDLITFGIGENFYPQAQGVENFINQLSEHFPKEKENLKKYIQLIDDVTQHFPLYQLQTGDELLKQKVTSFELRETINGITRNQCLQNVLLGNNLLYAGRESHTPFYLHALVVKSYIDSAGKFSQGSSQITKLLLRQFRNSGGQLLKKEKVTKLHTAEGSIISAETQSGRFIFAKQYIANIHPNRLLTMIDQNLFKPAFIKRMEMTKNTISCFMVNLVLKSQKVIYPNSNIYWHQHPNALAGINYTADAWPTSYALYFNRDKKSPQFAESVSVLTYMHFEEWSEWASSFNNSTSKHTRPEGYTNFKEKKTRQLLKVLGIRFPEIINNIDGVQVASPLTFRDYIGTQDGNLYGIEKNIQNPIQTQISVHSKVSNLFFTGQNAGVHGVLGVSITAIATCGAILGLPYLVDKINSSY